MQLFVEDKLAFEKIGMEVRLSEDPNDWPQQILDELYRQVPYASDYAPKVVLQEVDADRRYGLGQIELSNRMAINPRDDSTPPALKGGQQACIPVIIQDGKLKQLDLLLSDGKVEPLTEERLRKALFRPSLFEAVRERPGDMSMIEQLYPPHRQYGGARGPLMADIGAAGATKEGSAKPGFLMEAILPTIKVEDVASLTDMLEKDASLREAVAANEYMSILKMIGGVQEKVASTQAINSKTAVIQLVKVAEGFKLKMADADEAKAPVEKNVSRSEAVNNLGPAMTDKAEQEGQVTVSGLPQAQDVGEAGAQPQDIAEFGKYAVTDMGSNQQLTGWVFPTVTDLDGKELPLMVFSDGEFSCMQESIAGTPVESEGDVPDMPPQGLGVFYFESPQGPVALIPVEVSSAIDLGDGEGYMCSTMMGESVVIKKVPGLQAVAQVDETTYGIPAEAGFLPFGQEVTLASGTEQVGKLAAARIMPSAVQVITDGSVFSFRGQPVEKIAHVMDTQFLPFDEAVFLGAFLGQAPSKFASDLCGIRKHASTELWFKARKMPTAAPAKTASVGVDALRASLLKEATAIDDPTAVDKILSIGFINPENVAIFASYIPEIESTIRRLSEVLMATRLGLKSVDEGAVQRALVHLDKVVAGLKTIDSAQA